MKKNKVDKKRIKAESLLKERPFVAISLKPNGDWQYHVIDDMDPLLILGALEVLKARLIKDF